MRLSGPALEDNLSPSANLREERIEGPKVGRFTDKHDLKAALRHTINGDNIGLDWRGNCTQFSPAETGNGFVAKCHRFFLDLFNAFAHEQLAL